MPDAQAATRLLRLEDRQQKPLEHLPLEHALALVQAAPAGSRAHTAPAPVPDSTYPVPQVATYPVSAAQAVGCGKAMLAQQMPLAHRPEAHALEALQAAPAAPHFAEAPLPVSVVPEAQVRG